MGVAYFVVVKPNDPSFSGFLQGGKVLALAEVPLADMARRMGALPLSAYLSGPPELIAEEIEEFERETGIQVPTETKPSSEQWFTPEEGAVAVQRLLKAVREEGSFSPALERALSELLQVLEVVSRRGLSWHFDLA
jgi:hypothetical protein